MKSLSGMICMILCFALVLSALPVGFAAEHPFADVPEGSWFDEAVQFVYENGLMNGTSATTFSPELHMSRGMIVTVLYRLEGNPETTGKMPFEDVPAKFYYHDAIAWSYENGIVNGVSGTQFAPDADVTREQLVTIFYRYANAKGYDTTSMNMSDYSDADQISGFARYAMIWAVVNGIINGVSDTTLVPQGNANRAQFATIMKRFAVWCENRKAPATVLTAEKDAQLHADLQNAIDGILDSETEIVHSDRFIPGKTYTGTAYYFSNDGDDWNNDGLSPESPWQSVGKMVEILDSKNGQVLKPGDAVFLRRGDTFRLPFDLLEVSVDGVTISAYGEGDKPIITASSENGSGKDKWKLVYEDDSGKKIWQFYKDIRDTSMVIFHDGEAFADRVYEYYDGANYISCEDTWWWMHDGKGVTLLDRLLPLEESLTEDMTFISRAKSPDTVLGEAERGPLYLRCDQGNPGALYDSIEFTEMEVCGLIYLQASDTVYDNISFRCNGNSFLKCKQDVPDYHWSDIENTVIQNCEFAYGGGGVWQYETWDSGSYIIVAQGDDIYTVVKNTTIRNNYFHDMASTTTTYEWDPDDTRISGGYYHVLDNVVVNTAGIRLDPSYALKYLDSVIIRGNQIWDTGTMDKGKIYYSEGSLVFLDGFYGEVIVEDNVFYGTKNGHPKNGLLNINLYSPREDMRLPGGIMPVIRDNTYVQYSGRKFGHFAMWWTEPDNQANMNVFIDDPDLKTKVAEITGDTTSEFYVVTNP